MQYVRKIFYLDLYREETKIKNCGYVKMEAMPSKTYFYFYLHDVPETTKDELEATLLLNREKVVFEHIKVRDGAVCEVMMTSGRMDGQQIKSIVILLAGQERILYQKIVACEKGNPDTKVVVEKEKTEQTAASTPALAASSVREQNETIVDSKWEQLKQMFSVVSVFGKDTETLLLNPRDLVVLPQEYHYLATNSFLMHGYYNYRQLLLTRWQSVEGEQYYIGVPGTFYEREKSVARMFGFEGFENGESNRNTLYMSDGATPGENRIYPGCFGYYMKKVSI